MTSRMAIDDDTDLAGPITIGLVTDATCHRKPYTCRKYHYYYIKNNRSHTWDLQFGHASMWIRFSKQEWPPRVQYLIH